MRLRSDRRQERIKEADERNQAWRALSPEKQLQSLDERLGVGIGAKRQRTKLNKACA